MSGTAKHVESIRNGTYLATLLHTGNGNYLGAGNRPFGSGGWSDGYWATVRGELGVLGFEGIYLNMEKWKGDTTPVKTLIRFWR